MLDLRCVAWIQQADCFASVPEYNSLIPESENWGGDSLGDPS